MASWTSSPPAPLPRTPPSAMPSTRPSTPPTVAPSSSGPVRWRPRTCSRSPDTARTCASPRTPWRPWPEAAPSSTRSRRTRSPTTASPPGSARWPRGTSPPSCARSCSARLVRSHAAGSGDEVEREVVRAMMLLRLATLATGRTGVRPETAHAYAAMLNAGSRPSCASTARSAAPATSPRSPTARWRLMGEGEVRDARRRAAPGRRRRCRTPGMEPMQLAEKEGLALINGTDGMLGMLVLACHDLRALCAAADVAGGDVASRPCWAPTRVFAADLQALRPHPGQAAASAANLRALLAGSRMASRTGPRSAPGCRTPTRCAAPPRSRGAARDTLAHAATVAGRELAAAIDNPVVPDDGRVESNGNFHGAPSATCSTSSRSRRRPGVDGRAAHRPAARRRPQRTACRRSSPTTPASTPGS